MRNLGGGTFDVSLLTIDAGIFEVEREGEIEIESVCVRERVLQREREGDRERQRERECEEVRERERWRGRGTFDVSLLTIDAGIFEVNLVEQVPPQEVLVSDDAGPVIYKFIASAHHMTKIPTVLGHFLKLLRIPDSRFTTRSF